MNQPTHYEILGIEKTASQDEIKKAYRDAAKKYHPDANEVANAALIFRMVNDAYETLSNTTKRSEYDKTLDEPNIQPPPQPTHTTYSYTYHEENEAEEPIRTVTRRELPFPLSILWAIVRTLLKIILVPSLSILVWFFSMSSVIIMGISAIVSFLLFLAVLMSWWDYFSGGISGIPIMPIIGTIITYALSPMGLPRAAMWLIGKMEEFRLFIKYL